MYKVFINDSSLSFLSKPTKGAVPFEGVEQLRSLFQHLDKASDILHLAVYAHNLPVMWEQWQSLFQIIEAAGGVVLNPSGEVLMIYRWQKWDLPKGKLEKGEDIDTAAQREVMEECGVPKPTVTKRLPDTYHTYEIDGQPVLKHTYWYEMRLPSKIALTPQTEEGITQVTWCDTEALRENVANTYGNILLLLEPYLF
ncbi:MAG: NUDIX domain-containing protein [Owenweeksia sp.]|nr:NUDIX domain-containing protein [Owenweeksia sp.]